MSNDEEFAAEELEPYYFEAPAEPKKKNKTKDVRIKVTEDQHAILATQADIFALSLQDLIRFQILGPSAAEKLPAHDKLLKMLSDLGHVGSNLNQAQRVLNSEFLTAKMNGGYIQDETLDTLSQEIKKTGRALTSLKTEIRKVLRLPDEDKRKK